MFYIENIINQLMGLKRRDDQIKWASSENHKWPFQLSNYHKNNLNILQQKTEVTFHNFKVKL